MSATRRHRVSLCMMTFAELEVDAADAAAAEQLALANASAARKRFDAAPVAHRVEVSELVDWRAPEKGTRWVEVDPRRPQR